MIFTTEVCQNIVFCKNGEHFKTVNKLFLAKKFRVKLSIAKKFSMKS